MVHWKFAKRKCLLLFGKGGACSTNRRTLSPLGWRDCVRIDEGGGGKTEIYVKFSAWIHSAAPSSIVYNSRKHIMNCFRNRSKATNESCTHLYMYCIYIYIFVLFEIGGASAGSVWFYFCWYSFFSTTFVHFQFSHIRQIKERRTEEYWEGERKRLRVRACVMKAKTDMHCIRSSMVQYSAIA